jgi:uncharacterized protein YbaR (Trm112 family)
MVLSPDFLSILVCPACKGDLAYDAAASTLTCPSCRVRYRVLDDIPDFVDGMERF